MALPFLSEASLTIVIDEIWNGAGEMLVYLTSKESNDGSQQSRAPFER